MTRDEAIERARKLMALGDSDNEHEAAAAMAQATALLERHSIETAELGDAMSEPPEPMTRGSWRAGGPRQIVKWKMHMAQALAAANGCTIYRDGPRVTVCGRRADVRATAKLWGWMVGEVERLARANCVGRGTAYANAFKHGATSTIREEIKRERDRLREAMRGTVSETALVIVDTRKREAEAFMRAEVPGLRTTRSATRISSGGGYAAGKSAGAGVYGRGGQGTISGGARRLGRG